MELCMHSSTTKTMGYWEWSLLIILSIIWGGSFFFIKVIVAELHPFTAVFGRVIIAAIVLNVIVLATGHRMPSSLRLWVMFMVMAFFNNLLPFSLIFWGETQIASGLASILNATTPLWTVLLAHFLTSDEKLTPNRFSSVLFGLLGVVIMIGPVVLMGLGLNVLAQLAVVGAAISYSFGTIYSKRFMKIAPIVLATCQLTCSTLMMIPIVIFVDRPWLLPMPTIKIWAALLALAILCTAFAYVIYFRLLSTIGATNLMLVTFLIPVSAILYGMTILGERLEFRHFIGMGLIGISLLWIDGRLLQVTKRLFRGNKQKPQPIVDDHNI